jgi:hypothetical protein
MTTVEQFLEEHKDFKRLENGKVGFGLWDSRIGILKGKEELSTY